MKRKSGINILAISQFVLPQTSENAYSLAFPTSHHYLVLSMYVDDGHTLQIHASTSLNDPWITVTS